MKQALIELREPISNQKSRQEKFQKDKMTLQVFDKELFGNKNVRISEYHKVLSIDTTYAIVYLKEGYEKSYLSIMREHWQIRARLFRLIQILRKHIFKGGL